MSLDAKPVSEDNAVNKLTFRRAFVTTIGAAESSAAESIALLDLGLKLHRQDGGTYDLSDSEHALLKKTVEANKVGWRTLILGQLYKKVV